jgi:hypothetical protein
LGLDVGQRDLRGLLHHVTELSREREAPLAFHRRRLDEQHVAAEARDRESGRNAGHGGALGSLEEELLTAEVFANVVDIHRCRS